MSEPTMEQVKARMRAMTPDQLDRTLIYMLARQRDGGFNYHMHFLGDVHEGDGDGAQANDALCQQLAGICCEEELEAWKRLSLRRIKAGDGNGIRRLEELMRARLAD